MDPITQQVVLATAGAAAAGEGLYVDEVFSTFLYDGTSSTQSINNGIDLSGEGGLVWIKNRENTYNHSLFDTERGATKRLSSNLTSAEVTESNSLTAFNSNGFTLNSETIVNRLSKPHVSWTFRKAPGFFDVVTWSGNSTTGRQISHNLGSTPGMILIKIVNSTYNWVVYHRSQGASKYGYLNSTNAFASASGDYNYFNGTEPTSTHFTVDSGNASARVHVNDFGSTYVAYVFAHDDQSFGTDSDEAIVKCGSYTGTGSNGNFINVGFEPQFLLIKNATSGSTNWMLLDVMRGLPAVSGGTARAIFANTSDAEIANNSIEPSPTGFTPTAAGSFTNASGATFIYMAIRRPHKPPTAGTDVFSLGNNQTNSLAPFYKTSGHVSDFVIQTRPATTSGETYFLSRLTNTEYLQTTSTLAGSTNSYYVWDYMDGMNSFTASSDVYGYDHYSFKRAPGFFDVVAYTGTGSARTVNHNLTVAPELLIVKCRSNNGGWATYSATYGPTKAVALHSTSGAFTYNPYWNSTAPTATQFTVATDGAVNDSTQTYVAYLFASLDGISKVGSYSGTGSDINVDCGFTAGARFVLIKRTDTTGDWYVFDSARGIVSGNDPYLLLNSTAAQVTNTDYIDPLNAGFTVTSSAPAALNTSGGTYIFLAIA